LIFLSADRQVCYFLHQRQKVEEPSREKSGHNIINKKSSALTPFDLSTALKINLDQSGSIRTAAFQSTP
jgi:hypothetical protein